MSPILDAIYHQVMYARRHQLREPTAVVLHPADWSLLAMEASHMLQFPAREGQPDSVMGLSIIRSTRQPEGTIGVVFTEELEVRKEEGTT